MSNELVKANQYATDIEVFKQLCKTCMASGKYGTEMNEATMLNIMLTAKDLGISPLKAVNGGFYIVNGKISMATGLMIDRIRAAGHSISVLEWTKEKCVLVGKRKDNGDTCKIEYTLEDAQLAGLLNSPTWKKHPKSMLSARAHSMLARVLFPDVVGNAYSEDERHEIAGIPAKDRPDVDPESIDIVAVDLESGEVKPKYTIQDIHAKMPEFSAEEIEDLLKLISTKQGKPIEFVIAQVMEDKDVFTACVEKLEKIRERKSAQ